MPVVPLPVIADVHRVTLNWAEPNCPQTAHNVMHFKTSAAGKTPLQVFTAIDAHVAAAMWDFVAITAHVNSVTVLPLDGVTAAQTFDTSTASKWQGAGTGSAMPQVAGVIKFVTGLRGPANRGRIFLPYVGEGEYANGQLSDVAATTTAWTTALNGWIADATTPLALGVASYKHSTWHQVVNVGAQARSRTVGRRLKRA